MKCKLVDVFSSQKLNGNSLTIFYDCDNLSSKKMLSLTQEMRQFESIFLFCKNGGFTARIFTLEEELDFAGHPLLGLAHHLHEEFGKEKKHDWEINLNKQTVKLTSVRESDKFTATMNQGSPEFIKTLSHKEASDLYSALNLEVTNQKDYPTEVVTTGLPYVILPVAGCLEKINFQVSDLSPLIEPLGAKFLYVLDVVSFEGRTWDNFGRVEDVATGSAAGPAAAYLYKHRLTKNHRLSIHQGRFVGRPSQMFVELICDDSEITDIKVSGNIVKIADISFTS